MSAAKLTGRVQPRLWTPPLRPLTARTSRGYEAARFAEIIGEPFFPWQRWLAIHALELNPDGTYRFRVVLVLVARQNGKSTVNRTLSLYRLYIDGARLILGVAQEVSLAREQWQMCLDTIETSSELAPDLAKVRRVNGDEWFRIAEQQPITNDDDEDDYFDLGIGGRYKIAASSRKAGRGLSVDQLVIDELREQRNWQAWSALSKTTMARPNSQIWCMSNAGDDDSVVLNQLRDAALAGRDPSIGLFEWSGPDDCALDDISAIRQANPGLGHAVSLQAVRTALTTDPPAVYRTEVLCQRVEQLDGAISYIAWKACHDPQGNLDAPDLRKRAAACFDIAPDGQHATLAVAARTDDGRPRVTIARAWKNADDARNELPALITRIKPAAFTWYPGGPAAEMATVLRPIALHANARPGKRRPGDPPEDGEISGQHVSEVCQELAAIVRGRRILHPGDPLLDTHIKSAAKLHTGDGWRFTRRGGGHCDAAYAAAGAVSTALALPEPKRSKIRMLSQ
jgi:hypothetical protein